MRARRPSRPNPSPDLRRSSRPPSAPAPRRGPAAVAALVALAIPLGALAATTAPANALVSTIEVDEVADELNADGDCSLREAVETINTGMIVDGCYLPIDPIVDLPAGLFLLSDPLVATAPITIRGVGSVTTSIECSGVSGPCIHNTGVGAQLRLEDTAISMGNAALVESSAASGGLRIDRVAAWSAPTGFVSFGGPIEVIDSSVWHTDHGVVSAGGAAVEVTGSVLGGNDVVAVSSFAGPISVDASTVHQNAGSGIETATGPVTVRSSTVADNGGDGVRTLGGSVTFESATVVGNQRAVDLLSGAADASFLNTIVADHLVAGCADAVTSLGFNVADDDTCSFDQATDRNGLDPRLLALDTSTVTPVYPLADDSPLIDTGGACGGTDQIGGVRPVDGDGDGTAGCDVGAVEHEMGAPESTEPIDPTGPTGPGGNPPPAGPARPVPGRPTFTG